MVGFIWLCFGVLCQTVSTDASSGMEYVLFTFRQPWNTARKVCRGHGGRLAILDTVEQLASIRNLSEGLWGYEFQYRWAGLQVNQSMLLWEGTCEEQDLSNASLALFNSRYAESPGFTSGQCFVLPSGQHVLSDHPCDHDHPFICELHAIDGVSINSQNTTGYMEEGDDSKAAHQCEPAVLDGQTTTEMDQTTTEMDQTTTEMDQTTTEMDQTTTEMDQTTTEMDQTTTEMDQTTTEMDQTTTEMDQTTTEMDQTTTEMDQTTQVTSVPTDETSSPANDNIGGLIEASWPANDIFVGADENTSPANDQHVDAVETSSPVIVNYSDEVTFVPSDVTPSPAIDQHVEADETSSPVIVNYSDEVTFVPSDVTPSPANDQHVEADETSSPVIVNYSGEVTSVPSDETPSPANDNYLRADETTSPPIVNYTREDETSSPANDNSGTTYNIVDSADSTPRATESQVCREYNIPVMSEKELGAVLAAIAKELAVDKENLSSRVRKKVSAHDHRPSAASIGYVAVFIISIPVFVILVLDIPRAVQQIKCVFFTIKTKGRPTRTAKLV